MRYKLIIDASEDSSVIRLLFTFGVLQRKGTKVYMLSDFPGDANLQKVKMLLYIYVGVYIVCAIWDYVKSQDCTCSNLNCIRPILRLFKVCTQSEDCV